MAYDVVFDAGANGQQLKCLTVIDELCGRRETMTETKIISANNLRKHWFWPAAFAIVAVNVMVLAIDGWQAPRIKEFGVLFDFALLIPALYFICYRTSGKKAFVRTIAFACLGVWVAGHVVPNTHHFLISQIDCVRYVGLAVLVLIEIRLAIEIWRLAFRGHAEDPSQAIREKAEKEGVPPWVATLMAAEAKFWKKLWRSARKLRRRSS